jgi:hypothetical protein
MWKKGNKILYSFFFGCCCCCKVMVDHGWDGEVR